MKKIIFLISLLVISSCQEQVYDSWVKANGPYTRDYRGKSGIQDFAVYGWLKIDPSLNRNLWCTIVGLGNTEQYINDQSVGSQAFSLYVFQYQFEYNLYSTKGFRNGQIKFTDQDVGQWIFFHASFSQAKQKVFIHMKFASGVVNRPVDGIAHNNYDLFKLVSGQNAQYGFFPGTIRKLTIRFGEGSYREDGFDNLSRLNPDQKDECIIIYGACDFQGKVYELCQPRTVPNEEIRSIYIPPNLRQSLRIPNPYYPDDKSKSIVFDKTNKCIAPIVWTKFVEEKTTKVGKALKSKHLKKQKKN